MSLFVGTAASERIEAGHGNDTILAMEGADTLLGHGGNDWIFGFDGNDDASGGDGGDTIEGGNGNDTLEGGADFGADSLLGQDGDDHLLGMLGSDTLIGGAGNDVLDSFGSGSPTALNYWADGPDYLYGGEGDDILVTTGVDLMIDGGIGYDTLLAFYGKEEVVDITAMPIFGVEALHGAVHMNGWVGGSYGFQTNYITAGGIRLTTAQLDSFQTIRAGSLRLADSGVIDLTNQRVEGFTALYAADGNDTIIAPLAFDPVPLATASWNATIGWNKPDEIRSWGEALFKEFYKVGAPGSASNPGLIDGGAGDDSILGGGWNSVMRGGEGADSIWGYIGADLIEGGNGNDLLDGGANADTLQGGAGADTLRGGVGEDWLFDGTGSDRMEGGAGDDSFFMTGGTDNDTVIGGDGLDTVRVTGLNVDLRGVVLNGVERVLGLDTALTIRPGQLKSVAVIDLYMIVHATGGSSNFGRATSEFNAQFWGSSEADTAVAPSDAAKDLVFSGNGGNDLLATGEGRDLLDGGEGNDDLRGKGGNDTLNGGTGADTMYGGSGNDTYVVDNAGDVLIETDSSIDTVKSFIDWTLASRFEHLELMTGGLVGTGSSGANRMGGSGGADLLLGMNGADTLLGNDGNDTLDGGAHNDLLRGHDGADSLSGGSGADTLEGGSGADDLTGGTSNDVFLFARPADAGDVIRDFVAGADDIAISAAGFGGGLVQGMSVGATGRFAANAAGTTTSAAGVGQFVYNTTSGELRWDADGAGGAASIGIATLVGAPGLLASDIVLIA